MGPNNSPLLLPGQQAPQAMVSIPELGVLAERIRTFEVRLQAVETQLQGIAENLQRGIDAIDALQSAGIGGLMKLMKGSE